MLSKNAKIEESNKDESTRSRVSFFCASLATARDCCQGFAASREESVGDISAYRTIVRLFDYIVILQPGSITCWIF